MTISGKHPQTGALNFYSYLKAKISLFLIKHKFLKICRTVMASLNAFLVSELAGVKVSFKPRRISPREKCIFNTSSDVLYMKITVAACDIHCVGVGLFVQQQGV
jgi:hypothetical protein